MRRYTVLEWRKLVYRKSEDQDPNTTILQHDADRLAALASRSTFAGRNGSGVLVHGRDALHARGVVGVLVAGDTSLEILPKIDVAPGQTTDHQNGEIRKRLVHMLAVVLDLKIDLGVVTDLAWQRETLLEILIRVFCDKLTAALRKGMPRRYVTHEDDLPILRGQLDITRQFTRHAINPSRLACRFDLLSEDTPFNRIMKAAVLHLARLSRRAANQQRLRELTFVYADITDVPVSALRWDQVVIDRTNRSWQELFVLARLFLQRRYQTTTDGVGQGTALLFEMNALFEKYVGRLVVRALAGTGLAVSPQGGRQYCLTPLDSERALFQTKPDILIRKDSKIVHIIDTKWKKISARIDDPKQGVSQADVYQMMAYAQVYNAPRLTLLYPHHLELEGHKPVQGQGSFSITGHGAILKIASIDVTNSTDKSLQEELHCLIAGEESEALKLVE